MAKYMESCHACQIIGCDIPTCRCSCHIKEEEPENDIYEN